MNKPILKEPRLNIRFLASVATLSGYAVLLHLGFSRPRQGAHFFLAWLPSLYLLATTVLLILKFGISWKVTSGNRRPLLGTILVSLVAVLMVAVGLFWPDRSTGPPRLLRLEHLVLILLVPVAEELFFRGFLMDVFWRFFQKPTPAAILCSLIFSLAHLPQGTIIGIVMFLLSLLMCFAVFKTGSMIWPIAVHLAWNSAVVLKHTRPGTERIIMLVLAFVFLLLLFMRAFQSSRSRADGS